MNVAVWVFDVVRTICCERQPVVEKICGPIVEFSSTWPTGRERREMEFLAHPVLGGGGGTDLCDDCINGEFMTGVSEVSVPSSR